MCLILFAYRIHPEYPLVLAANRDEYYQRPAQAFHWWPESPSLLAGKDLVGGGTWMGITKQGQFAAITNVREGKPQAGDFRSRGLLLLDFFNNSETTSNFNRKLQATAPYYRGYNLLFGSLDQLQYFSNRSDQPTPLKPGIYGLSNARLDTPWPKVVAGKQQLATQIRQPEPSAKKIFKILETTDLAKDDQLPDTGIGLDLERQLSAICIVGEEYGTRSSCVLFVNRKGEARLCEKERAPIRGSLTQHTFQITTY